MALPFSAEYLYQGSKVLGYTPPLLDLAGWDNAQGKAEKLFAIARGIYSLGLLIIAPFGAIYHSAIAGYYELRLRCGSNDPRIGRQFNIHFEAALVDGKAFLTTASGPFMIAMLITTFLFLKYLLTLPLFISLPVFALCALIGYLLVDFCRDMAPLMGLGLFETIFLPLAYANDRTHFLTLIEHAREADPSLLSIYLAHEHFKQYVRAGIVANRRLGEEEIPLLAAEVLAARRAGIRRNVPILSSIGVMRLLFEWADIRPAYQGRVEDILRQQEDMTEIWRAVRAEHSNTLSDQAMLARCMPRFQERLQPILAVLRPVVAAAPARAAIGPAPDRM